MAAILNASGGVDVVAVQPLPGIPQTSSVNFNLAKQCPCIGFSILVVNCN